MGLRQRKMKTTLFILFFLMSSSALAQPKTTFFEIESAGAPNPSYVSLNKLEEIDQNLRGHDLQSFLAQQHEGSKWAQTMRRFLSQSTIVKMKTMGISIYLEHGETIGSLAKKLNVPIEELREIETAEKLGAQLKLPIHKIKSNAASLATDFEKLAATVQELHKTSEGANDVLQRKVGRAVINNFETLMVELKVINLKLVRGLGMGNHDPFDRWQALYAENKSNGDLIQHKVNTDRVSQLKSIQNSRQHTIPLEQITETEAEKVITKVRRPSSKSLVAVTTKSKLLNRIIPGAGVFLLLANSASAATPEEAAKILRDGAFEESVNLVAPVAALPAHLATEHLMTAAYSKTANSIFKVLSNQQKNLQSGRR
ncbi:MAG: hypothetical protein AB7F59_14225 [Bdellovibrionales bacterium]